MRGGSIHRGLENVVHSLRRRIRDGHACELWSEQLLGVRAWSLLDGVYGRMRCMRSWVCDGYFIELRRHDMHGV